MADVTSDQSDGRQEWTVTGVEKTTDATGRIPLWIIVYQVPETVSPDRQFRYIVPMQLPEIRAAEYGLATLDETLELIMYEPLLGIHQGAGTLPMLAPADMPVEQAREQMRDELATCKEQFGVVTLARPRARGTASSADPLQVIRDEARVDPINVAAMRLEMDRYLLAQTRQ